MALFHSRRVTPQKVIVFLLGGFGIGTVIGYIFMATAHTARLCNPTPTVFAHTGQPTCSNHGSLSSTIATLAPSLRTREACCLAYADAGDQG